MEAPRAKPFLLGITGGIGAGKSTISKVFEILEVPVYYADQQASWLMDNDEGVRDLLLGSFGKDALKDGKANKEFFRNLVFENEAERKKLNGIVHPAVGRDFKDWVDSYSDSPYLLKEAALLIESGSYKELDMLIGVFAPRDERIKRVLRRDTFRREEDVIKIISRQMPEEEMRKFCQFQIENDGTKSILEEVLNFDKSLKEHLAEKNSV